jgi:hypothetical protein
MGLMAGAPGKSGWQHSTEGTITMAGGLVAGIIAFAVGAVVDFAFTANQYQHGFNVHTVGIILMIVGAVGAALSLLSLLFGGFHRHRTVVDDGRGNVVERDDSFH